ncbi:MAG: heat-inducible transcription repressor HrcA [Candidatus Eisenbacteria bacterium]|nr:heat-inducible transcription repressor HrcA [Candidatus Eisenbacteria bacterium]
MFEPAVPGHLTLSDPDLNPRQRSVLAALVTVHGATARPVGSETLARDPSLPISAASVRAALVELENAGLIERPSAAAGRVPSAHGYEYFVRVLLRPERLPAEIEAEIYRRLQHSARDVEHLLAEASRLISSLTHQLGLAHGASLEHETLVGLDLEPLDARRTLMVLRLGTSRVRTLVLELESPLESAELAEVCAVLRERLIGRALAEVRERLASDPELVRGSAARMVVRAASERWSDPRSHTLFSSGVSNIAGQPEFMDGLRLGPLLHAVERCVPIERLMASGMDGQAAVRIGLDAAPELAGCSLVSYALPGSVWGAVGVLGPRRMDYARVLAVVDTVGARVTDLLQG